MDFALLKALTEAVGTPGREEAVRAVLRDHLAGCAGEVRTDPMGNLIVRRGRGPVRVLLDAHMDEVGLAVAGHTPEGLLRVKTSGGIDDRVLAGRPYWVGPRRVPGVIGLKALHMAGGDEDRAVPARELLLDVGARSREEAEAVAALGDPVVWATPCEQWGDHIVKAKALDDRAGCALLVELLRGGGWDEQAITLYVAFTVQEEVGLRGARAVAEQVRPHVALAIDCTPAGDGPGAGPEAVSTYLGQGPAIYVVEGRVVDHARVTAHLQGLAAAAGIPWQPRRRTAGGTDAGAIWPAAGGVPVASVSVPARYLHAGAALMDRRDYDHTLALVRAFVASVAKGALDLCWS